MGRGKVWERWEIDTLKKALEEPGSTYEIVKDTHFPTRSANAVSQAARKYLDLGNRVEPDWTLGEIKQLASILDSYTFRSWGDVAKRQQRTRHGKNRTGAACKHAAVKFIPLPEGRRSHLRASNHLIRKYGPPNPWVPILGRIVTRGIIASGKSKSMIANEAGIARLTLDNLVQGRRAPRMPLYVAICDAAGIDAGKALATALAVPRRGNAGPRGKGNA